MPDTTSPEKPSLDNLAFIQSRQVQLHDIVHTCHCPACGYHVAVKFYDGGRHPLTTLAWPKSKAEAQAMEKLPLNFVRCVDCGHVYNRDFSYDKVPYSDKPNLMYNKGSLWKEHLDATIAEILLRLPENATVIEVGAGDGHFIKAIANQLPQGRYIAFDPNGSLDTNNGQIEFFPKLFEPAKHMAEFRPDLVICRHMLEHLENPLEFVQSLSFAAQWENLNTALFIEVPCIDRVFASGRTVDFFYEHNSHFTSESLSRMLSRANTKIELLECGYEDEVVYAYAQLVGSVAARTHAVELGGQAIGFYNRAQHNDQKVRQQIQKLAGRKVALWGGTGKAATFINRYHADDENFPIVVDSDPSKVGTHVPGTGQEIRSPQYLLKHPVDVIVITTQWRAQDIALEIRQRGIPCQSILLEYQGELVDFYTGRHAYHSAEQDTAVRISQASPR
ncbi:MAG TPA: class I SAM-dependent methyltransferase [Oculatellaceae cyanobacterium]|jgi:hypothetical protein